MPRPKGSKNKTTSSRQQAIRFNRKDEREIAREIAELSVLTGIAPEAVATDAMKEGLATLREDGYHSLIKFRKRVGKVVHERDLESNGAGSEEPARQEAGSQGPALHQDSEQVVTIGATERPGIVDERPGHATESDASAEVPNTERIGRQLVEEIVRDIEAGPPGMMTLEAASDLPL